VVSNRLPIVVEKDEGGEWTIIPGSGGLVTALSPVLRNRGGLWIGWLGTGADDLVDMPSVSELLSRGTMKTGYKLETVNLSQEEIQKYYYGFSNEILWPLFHDLVSRGNFDPAYWETYQQVNRKFAEVGASCTREDDFVWVHDYQLIMVAQYLRSMEKKLRVGFSLHTPFPPPDIFVKLPWRFQILGAMLQYDLLGFQTVRDRKNFLGCVRAIMRNVRISGARNVSKILTEHNNLLAGTFPISIDFKEFAELAATAKVSNLSSEVHANLPKRHLILGVDRLDYSKGIPQKLAAFANALERYPDLHCRISLIQVVVPSRQNIREYDALKREIECLVGEINGRFTREGWISVIYIYSSLDRLNSLAYYRSCEIALITPLKDGMNLVAKEYCTASVDMGVLIISEFAGAASQLWMGALLVNPHDIEGVADTIHKAFAMEHEERRRRMMRLPRSVARSDIYRWVDSFLKAAIAKGLNDFRRLEDLDRS
jgi:trehalose 6-phosphate synthase